MRLVGILLISSLIVIPNITAMMFGTGFRRTALISVFISMVSVVSGIVLSYILNSGPEWDNSSYFRLCLFNNIFRKIFD